MTEESTLWTYAAAQTSVRDDVAAAVAAIDAALGSGAAKASPALVASYLNAVALKSISVALAEAGNGLYSALMAR